MKVSVSVPDELWDEASATVGLFEKDVSPSALVQRALQSYVSSSSIRAPRYRRERPVGAANQISTIAKRLEAEAHREFEAGYHRGIKLSENVGWRDFETVVRAVERGSDLRKTLYQLVAGERAAIADFDKELSDVWIETGSGYSFTGSDVFWQGVSEALRDIFLQVRAPIDDSGSTVVADAPVQPDSDDGA